MAAKSFIEDGSRDRLIVMSGCGTSGRIAFMMTVSDVLVVIPAGAASIQTDNKTVLLRKVAPFGTDFAQSCIHGVWSCLEQNVLVFPWGCPFFFL